MGQFILTGSQKFSLMQSVSDSLAGRCAIVDLEGLSLHELAKGGDFPKSPAEMSSVITRGSFPELWRDPEIPAPVFYNSYLATYLERDVRQILNVTNLRNFERFMRACAARTAQQLDKNALANDVGVSSKAVSSWLNVLVASNQIVLLEPWFANIGKRLVKSPKLYFNDTGLASHLMGISSDNFATSPFVGPLWENAVFGEIRRYLSLSQRSDSVWFYRDNQQREIDFMVLAGGKAALLECKWAERPDDSATKSITELQKLVREKKIPDFSENRGFVVCRTPHQFPLGKSDVHAISLEHLRENLEKALV
jgi:predicted AAA+ superfamily ATPase